MDWKRVESILIVAFIIINVMLFFALSENRKTSNSEVLDSDKRIELVKKLLDENGISLDFNIKDKTQKIHNLHLTYETYEDEGFIRLLLGNLYINEDNNYISDDAQVTIVNEQNLIYKKNTLEILESPRKFKSYSEQIKNDKVAAIAVAESFLKETGIKSSSVKFWKVIKWDKNAYCVKYRQYEEGYFLEDAYMDVVVKYDKVVELNRKWFGAIGTDDVYIEIESPVWALFRLIANEEYRFKEPIAIKSLELGYRLVSDIVPVRFLEGDSTPYWRMETDGGKIIYLKAKEVIE